MDKWIIPLLLMLIIFPCFAYEEIGTASWYGGKYQNPLNEDNYDIDDNSLTAAHRTLPMNTEVLVTNLANKKSVVVRINDRGPVDEGKIIDLSQAAAEAIGMMDNGTAEVKLVVKDQEQLKIFYTIQVGVYKNLEEAGNIRKRLIASGFSPKARLDNQGITRILLEKIPEEDTFFYTTRLEELGIDEIVILQNS